MSSLLVTKAAPRRRVWPWALAAVGVVCIGALAFAFFAWPSGGLGVDANALPQVQQPRFSGDLVAISLHDAAGKTIPVSLHADGTVRPLPSGPGRHPPRRRGGLPPSRLGRLDRRTHADGRGSS